MRGEEDGEEGIGGIELGRGGVVWHLGGEEAGDGVEEVGEAQALEVLPVWQYWQDLLAPPWHSPHCRQSHGSSRGQVSLGMVSQRKMLLAREVSMQGCPSKGIPVDTEWRRLPEQA